MSLLLRNTNAVCYFEKIPLSCVNVIFTDLSCVMGSGATKQEGDKLSFTPTKRGGAEKSCIHAERGGHTRFHLMGGTKSCTLSRGGSERTHNYPIV